MSKRGTPPLVPCLLSVALCHRRTATRPEQSSQAGLACVSGPDNAPGLDRVACVRSASSSLEVTLSSGSPAANTHSGGRLLGD